MELIKRMEREFQPIDNDIAELKRCIEDTKAKIEGLSQFSPEKARLQGEIEHYEKMMDSARTERAGLEGSFRPAIKDAYDSMRAAAAESLKEESEAKRAELLETLLQLHSIVRWFKETNYKTEQQLHREFKEKMKPYTNYQPWTMWETSLTSLPYFNLYEVRELVHELEKMPDLKHSLISRGDLSDLSA